MSTRMPLPNVSGITSKEFLMTSRIASQHLGSLSDAQLQAALDRFHLGRFLGAESVPFGTFRQNVFVSSTKGDFVPRGNPLFWWLCSSRPNKSTRASCTNVRMHLSPGLISSIPLPTSLDGVLCLCHACQSFNWLIHRSGSSFSPLRGRPLLVPWASISLTCSKRNSRVALTK